MAAPNDQKCHLLVKRFSQELSNGDKIEFINHFGGKHVTCFPKGSPLGNSVLAKFETEEAAQRALSKLHQLELFGKRLAAEYASEDIIERANREESRVVLNKSSNLGNSKKKLKIVDDEFNPNNNEIAIKLGVQNEFPKHLRYFYPPPSVTILTNIANAMASVPKFYTQVLHLMNKMNLPPPFSALTPAPPLPGDSINLVHVGVDTCDLEEFCMSSSESELESDGEQQLTTDKPHAPVTHKQRDIKADAIRKGKRALKLAKADRIHGGSKRSRQETNTPHVAVSEAFEQNPTTSTSRIEFKLNATIASQFQAVVYNQNITNEQDLSAANQIVAPILKEIHRDDSITGDSISSGFGVIEPVNVTAQDTAVSDDSDEETDPSKRQWISLSELRRNRLSCEELSASPQLKSYEKGEKTSRLYIKNLAKQTDEKDLRYVYLRFAGIDGSMEDSPNFDIRLMKEGRMKGQAFVSFSSPELAGKALAATHGYILKEKPMIVSFARSARPKE